VIPEDFHGGFSLRIVSWFEAQSSNAKFVEESTDCSDEVVQSQILVDHESFDLVEFSEVGGIQGFVAEHPVDRKEFTAPEFFCFVHETALGYLFEHSGADCRGVGPENQRASLLLVPVVVLANRASGAPVFVSFFDDFHVVEVDVVLALGHFHEEGVMSIACGVLLRLE